MLLRACFRVVLQLVFPFVHFYSPYIRNGISRNEEIVSNKLNWRRISGRRPISKLKSTRINVWNFSYIKFPDIQLIVPEKNVNARV